MTFNLFELTHKVARELGVVYAGTCTAGSATTIADTTLSRFDNDYFNKVDKGTAWILHDAAGAGGAPEGEYGRITDFVSTTGVVTIETLSTAVASGDRYALVTDQVPLNQIISSINATIEEYTVPVVNSTAIVIADNQTEYTLPFTHGKLLKCWYQGDTSDDDDNRWMPMPRGWWEIQTAAAGTADTIRFRHQFSSTHAIMLEYETNHAPLYNSTHMLHEHVPMPLVVYPAALDLAWWMKDDTNTDEKDSRIMKLEQKAARAQAQYKIEKPKRGNKTWALGGAGYVPDSTVNSVILK